jgi:hypothetical protein
MWVVVAMIVKARAITYITLNFQIKLIKRHALQLLLHKISLLYHLLGGGNGPSIHKTRGDRLE